MQHAIYSGISTLRVALLITVLLLMASALLTRAAYLQWLEGLDVDHVFLQNKAAKYSITEERIKTDRASIIDRNGAILASSIPLLSLVANPLELAQASAEQLQLLSLAVDIPLGDLHKKLLHYKHAHFMYLRRHQPPAEVQNILDLKVPGLSARVEYQRFYPAAEYAAPLVGVTNIDDSGVEGLELSYDNWLAGEDGINRIRRDRSGKVTDVLAELKIPRSGEQLRLSLDMAIQYATYRALKEAVVHAQAKSGNVAVLDVDSGEILALASYPSPNPNQLTQANSADLRNRAALDLFEPGSIVKPFVIAAALQSGIFTTESIIDTAPGCTIIVNKKICDPNNHGQLTLEEVLTYSSQVGIVRVALDLPTTVVSTLLRRVGIGSKLSLQLPMNPSGVLPDGSDKNEQSRAALAYGYTLSSTTLQWLRAYSVFANRGKLCPMSLLYKTKPYSRYCREVMDPAVASAVLNMMATVVSKKGTGTNAQVLGYSVAGKTATIRKFNVEKKTYTGEEHIAVFAGIAPVRNPRIVVVVHVDEPKFYYYGGAVAAPLFSKVARFALRRLNVPADNFEELMQSRSLVKVVSTTALERH